MKPFLPALAAVTLAGCAATQTETAGRTDLDVCKSFGIYVRSLVPQTAEPYRQEIERRKLMSADEWARARTGSVKVGDSQCLMYIAKGGAERENRSVGSWGVRTQHVYNSGLRNFRPTYIYTTNGKVTSFQD